MASTSRADLQRVAGITQQERAMAGFAKSIREVHKASKSAEGDGVLGAFMGSKGRNMEKAMTSAQRGFQRLTREYENSAKKAQKAARDLGKLRAVMDTIEAGGGKPTAQQTRRYKRAQQRARKAKSEKRRQAQQMLRAQQDLKGADSEVKRAKEQERKAQEAQDKQDREERKKKRRRRAKRVAKSALGLALKAGRWIKGQADQGLETAMANMMGTMESSQLLGPQMAKGWKSARREAIAYGNSLGYNNAETHKFLQMTAKATGGTGYGQVKANLQMARAYTMDMGEITGYQSQARRAGGTGTTRQINKTLIRAFKMGGYARPLMSEFVQAATQLTGQTADSRENMGRGTLPNLIGMLGSRLGGAYGRSPQRTSRLLGGLHGTIAQTSGHDAAQALRLRAVGFGRAGGPSYVQALKQLEKGITDPSNIRNMLRQVKAEHGGNGEMAQLALHRMSGGRIKLHAAERLLNMDTAGMSDKALTAAAGTQQANLARQGENSRSGLGFIRRQIALMNQRAALRVKLDKLYKVAFDIQMKAMKTAAEAYKRAESITKNLAGGFQHLQGEASKLADHFRRLYGSKDQKAYDDAVGNLIRGQKAYGWNKADIAKQIGSFQNRWIREKLHQRFGTARMRGRGGNQP